MFLGTKTCFLRVAWDLDLMMIERYLTQVFLLSTVQPKPTGSYAAKGDKPDGDRHPSIDQDVQENQRI